MSDFKKSPHYKYTGPLDTYKEVRSTRTSMPKMQKFLQSRERYQAEIKGLNNCGTWCKDWPCEQSAGDEAPPMPRRDMLTCSASVSKCCVVANRLEKGSVIDNLIPVLPIQILKRAGRYRQHTPAHTALKSLMNSYMYNNQTHMPPPPSAGMLFSPQCVAHRESQNRSGSQCIQ